LEKRDETLDFLDEMLVPLEISKSEDNAQSGLRILSKRKRN
jgi:hypothetical protein